jgi:hypothetical protein
MKLDLKLAFSSMAFGSERTRITGCQLTFWVALYTRRASLRFGHVFTHCDKSRLCVYT